MSTSIGHSIVTSDLVIALDAMNPRCKATASQTTWDKELTGTYDLHANGLQLTDSSMGTDFDAMTNVTYFTTFYIHSHHADYSHNLFKKYAGASTAVLNLYDFGDSSSNQMGYYAARGGSWGTIGALSGSTTVGTYINFSITHDSAVGGQAWKNGAKYGSVTSSGVLGTNTADMYIEPSYTGSLYAKVVSTYVYLRTLTDAEMIQNYNAVRKQYSI
jgi:hypothetical protein